MTIGCLRRTCTRLLWYVTFFFAQCSVFKNNISQTVSRSWSEARQINFDLVCDNFPEENQQSVASSKECTQLHTIQARLRLKDLINGCVTAVGKQAVDIHRKTTELICHSCHHNTLLAPIEGSSTCWRENKHVKCVPWFDPALMENKPQRGN